MPHIVTQFQALWPLNSTIAQFQILFLTYERSCIWEMYGLEESFILTDLCFVIYSFNFWYRTTYITKHSYLNSEWTDIYSIEFYWVGTVDLCKLTRSLNLSSNVQPQHFWDLLKWRYNFPRFCLPCFSKLGNSISIIWHSAWGHLLTYIFTS